MPLALSIVASRATAHPSFPLAALAEELRLTRLGALDEGDGAVSLTAVLSWSYAALSPQEAMVFRMLGIAGTADVSLRAVAAMAQLPSIEAARVLRALERVSLVHEHMPGRYRMHDLVQLYAEDLARQDGSRQEAVRGLVDFYLHTAHNGDLLLDPDGQDVSLAPPRGEPLTFGSQAEALQWFDIEHRNVLAAQQLAEGDAVWQLAWVLHAYHWWRGHLHDDLRAWRAAASAASDLSAKVLVHQMLGYSCSRLWRFDEAFDQLDRALALVDRLGDHELAHSSAGKALEVFQEHEYAPGKAAAFAALGTLLASIGDYACAMAYHESALTIRRELGNSYAEADTLAQLGLTYSAMGRPAWARSCWSAALALYRSQNRVADVEKALRELDLLVDR